MSNNIFQNKNVLVTGGSGMIGRQLVDLLIEKQANVFIADIKKPTNLPKNIVYNQVDLKEFSQCVNICNNMNYIFNLVGIKASPKACIEQPANIIGPMLQFNTNMMEAAMICDCEWYLYTSTVGVYHPAQILKEDDVWNTFPSKNDWFGGWAKRMGELIIQAYEVQNKINKCSIVRPANVYGPYDNFDLKSAMVIPSLIRKADEETNLEVWGDGSQIRDFIHSSDVARGMIHAVENKINEPLNLGSGKGVSIKIIAETIANYFSKNIIWNDNGPAGDPVRIFDTQRAKKYGFEPMVNIEEGILNTIDWYLNNKKILMRKYEILK